MGRGIPRFTTLMGKLCAENIRSTSLRTSSGYVASCVSIFCANASTSPGCVGHRSMTLHFTPPPSGSFPSSRIRHFQSSFNELPVVEQLYCGYCVNATARPCFPNPSSNSLTYISSVKGSAYRNATYGLCGALSGHLSSRSLHISSLWYSDHLRIGEPPPMAAYWSWIFGVRRREIKGPR